MKGSEAFGSDLPMTDTWFVGRPDKVTLIAKLVDEVDLMLDNLFRDECIHIYAKKKWGPDASDFLPRQAGEAVPLDCQDLDCIRCENVLGEVEVLSDLKWTLIRMTEGDFYEIRDFKTKERKAAHYPVHDFYIEQYIKNSQRAER